MARTMKNTVLVVTVLVFAAVMVGCMTHEHVVGTGATTGYTESAKQWYLINGLVPLNDVDTKAMSGGAENYKIVTQTTIIDAIITGFTGGLLSPRTVQVIK
jgi:hypothetical protein